MLRIKRCPKCGHRNPEPADLCEVCEEFLGLVAPETVSDPVEPEPVVPDPADGSPPATPGRVTQVETAAPSLLYLESPAGHRNYPVKPGDIVGQAHPTSLAQVQIESLPGVDRIHRQHGRFDWRDGQWHVTALDQRPFGSDFTNSTVLNGQRLAPGDSQPIQSGARLTLAGVLFTVRIA
jgi:hypothetical protein